MPKMLTNNQILLLERMTQSTLAKYYPVIPIPVSTLILGILPSVLSFCYIEDYKHVRMNVRLYDKEEGLVSLVNPRIGR